MTNLAARLEDGQPRRRRIVGPLLGLDVLHAGVLDADLLRQERDFVLEALNLGPEAEVEALGRPDEGCGQGEIGKGNGVHSCRADAAGTASIREETRPSKNGGPLHR